MKKIVKWLIALSGIILVLDLGYRVWDIIKLKDELNGLVEKGNYYSVINSKQLVYDTDNYSKISGVQGYNYEYPLKNEIWHIIQLRKNDKGDLHKYYIKPTKVISDVRLDSTGLYNCLEDALDSILSNEYIHLGEKLGKPCSVDSINYLINEAERKANSYDGVEFWHVDELLIWGFRDYFRSSVDVNNQRILIDGGCIDNRIMKYVFDYSDTNKLTAFLLILFILLCVWGLCLMIFSKKEKIVTKVGDNSIVENDVLVKASIKHAPIKKISYWENFKEEKSIKAAEIEDLLNLDFSMLSDRDAKEKVETLERLSKSMKCPISQIKENYLKEIEQYPIRLIPQMIDSTKKEMANEVDMFHILEGNTCSALMIKWLKERQENAPKAESYWETWKNQNPEKAKALKALTDREFDEMSTMDIKQTIKAFSSAAENHNLEDWMDIKDYYVSSYASFSENLGEEEAMRAISSILLDENNRANVSLFNSVYNYAKQWIQEYKENNADRAQSPEDKFRKEYREKLMNKIGSNAKIPLFCHGYDSPIAHELMYIMYQHLRNAELKAEAEKQGLWNKYVQIIVDETEKVTKKYCHVFLQECVEYYNYPDKPVVTRYRCPSCGSTNIMDDLNYGLECNECGRTWNAPYGKRLYL